VYLISDKGQSQVERDRSCQPSFAIICHAKCNQNPEPEPFNLNKVGYQPSNLNDIYYPRSWDMFDAMLNECQVVITPGCGFGSMGEGFVRFSCFGSHEQTEEAAARLKAWFAKTRGEYSKINASIGNVSSEH
jgi:aspartate/methionine/tyrosine aminotransferase